MTHARTLQTTPYKARYALWMRCARPLVAVGSMTAMMFGCGGTTMPGQSAAFLSAISVTCAASTVAVGATTKCTARAGDQYGRAIAVSSFEWGTSNSSVATVSSDGLVTAVKAGTVSVWARSGSISGASGDIGVTAAALASRR